MWNERYAEDDYAYGTAPNDFPVDSPCKPALPLGTAHLPTLNRVTPQPQPTPKDMHHGESRLEGLRDRRERARPGDARAKQMPGRHLISVSLDAPAAMDRHPARGQSPF